jgi:hypothetical protein
MRLTLPCGCVQCVRVTAEGLRLGRRLAACGPGGVHDGYRWPPFGIVLDEALRESGSEGRQEP